MRRTRKTMKPEEILVIKCTNYMKTSYPDIPFRVDQIDQVGLKNGIANSTLHGKWAKGYPDIFVATCRGKYGGLYTEIKATETVVDSEHTRTQRAYHAVLRKNGYKVSFCCGFGEFKKVVDKYLR